MKSKLNDLLYLAAYYFRPKYVVMKGLQIENRAIMFIGAHPKWASDDYGNAVVRFKNCKYEYCRGKVYRRIWTMRGLRKWRKLVGPDTKCLTKEFFGWRRT